MKYIIKCRFCGEKGGEIEHPLDYVDDIILGIEDHRCARCESEHGNYKEMSHRFQKEGSYEEFKQVIKNAGYSQKNFIIEVEKFRKSKKI